MFKAVKRFFIKKLVPTIAEDAEITVNDVTKKGKSYIRIRVEVLGFKILEYDIPDYDVVETKK